MAQDELAPQRLQRCVTSRLGLRIEERHQPLLDRMLAEHGDDVDAWLDRLEHSSGRTELHALADELAVGEGYFFRNAEQLQMLARLQEARGDRPLRVLSVGCGAGEEAYTLAMGLNEINPQSRVDAIDISPARLQQAMTGRYGDWSMRATPGSQRRRWFTREGGFHEVAPVLRARVHFEQRNLCEADPDFWGATRYDLVLCRHVLMHLETSAIERALNHMAQVLKPGGWLFLGRNESLRGRDDLFTPRESSGVFFYERGAGIVAVSIRAQGARLTPRPNPLWLRNGRETVFELWRQGRQGQALHLADSLLIQDRSDCELLLAQVMLLMQAGRIPEAQRVGMRLLSMATTPAMGAAARFAKARGHELRGEGDRAEESYRQAIMLDTVFGLAHLRLSALLRRRGDEDEASAELRRASELMDCEDERRILIFGEGQGRAELTALCGEAVAA